jgi:amino acid permease
LTDRKLTTFVPPPVNNSTAVLIIAVKEAGIGRLAGFLNACLILAILSAANTALYGKSRVRLPS